MFEIYFQKKIIVYIYRKIKWIVGDKKNRKKEKKRKEKREKTYGNVPLGEQV